MTQTHSPASPPAGETRKPFLPLVYVASVGGAYWVNFIWFYLQEHWGTNPVRNLLINAGFGLLYTAGCWRTARVSAYAAPASMLTWAYALLILMTLVSAVAGSPAQLAVVILLHAYVIARTWPNLEMLATAGKRAGELGRAVSLYNIGWALTSAVAYAAAGFFYKIHPMTLFLIPCLSWAGAILLVRLLVPPHVRPMQALPIHAAHDDPEPPEGAPAIADAFRSMSRLGNMGCYILISVLVPIMPAIAHRLELDTAEATLFGSLWQATRVAAFFILGRWHGWHFRRGMFLGFMLSLPALFGLTVLSPSLWVAAIAQLALGFSLGMIYTSALFYSMHGEAKTSEAAIHELVIGLGIMAGPLLSAACGYIGRRAGASEDIAIAASAMAVLAIIWAAMAWRAARSSAEVPNLKSQI